MSAPQGEDRTTRLDGFEIEIFKLVQREATSEQWKAWLRAPLEHAAAKGNMDLFTRLMDAGADGSAGWRGCHGRTLLGAAAYGKNEEMVLALLGAGAKDDVNVVFNGVKHESALHVAAAQGAEAVSNALMLAGADPNLGDGANHSPLHLAARAGQHVIVNNLLLRGADPNAKAGRWQCTALHSAAMQNSALCVSKLLLGGAEKDSRNNCKETPLYLAAASNHLGAAEKLLAAGANPDIRSSSGRSVLDIAAGRGSVGVLRALLRHGGDANTATKDDCFTVLHYAAQVEGPGDNGGVVRVLLEAGADIEARTTEEGLSPLHAAANCRRASSGTIRALLEGGADVNALDGTEQTPLHTACCRSSVDAVEVLLKWGADETLMDEDGETAEEVVGDWTRDDDDGSREQRKPDDQRIRHMLARAPADRSWRRRGWLVLCRSYPTKVQLAKDSSGGGSSAKVEQASCDGSGGDGEDIGDERVYMTSLVDRVVGVEADDVFRLVVGFL